jgi:hypothetical protein
MVRAGTICRFKEIEMNDLEWRLDALYAMMRELRCKLKIECGCKVVFLSDDCRKQECDGYELCCHEATFERHTQYSRRSQCLHPWLYHHHDADGVSIRRLFSVENGYEYEDDLNDGNISDELRREFDANGICLSQQSVVSVRAASDRILRGAAWRIDDGKNEQTYFLDLLGSLWVALAEWKGE